jgi:hypothetical protein
VSFRLLDDGTVIVEVYRCDPGVIVRVAGRDLADDEHVAAIAESTCLEERS